MDRPEAFPERYKSAPRRVYRRIFENMCGPRVLIRSFHTRTNMGALVLLLRTRLYGRDFKGKTNTQFAWLSSYIPTFTSQVRPRCWPSSSGSSTCTQRKPPSTLWLSWSSPGAHRTKWYGSIGTSSHRTKPTCLRRRSSWPFDWSDMVNTKCRTTTWPAF